MPTDGECLLLAKTRRPNHRRATSAYHPASDIPPPSSSRALTGIDLALCPLPARPPSRQRRPSTWP